MSDTEMHWWSTTETAQRIAAKEVSSREVLEHMVDRADRLDGQINAIIQRDLDRARAAADAADTALAAGQPLGPCLLYTSPSPRDLSTSRMPSSA